MDFQLPLFLLILFPFPQDSFYQNLLVAHGEIIRCILRQLLGYLLRLNNR